MDNRNCRDCKYFHGHDGSVLSCNYIFMEDKKRPCEPGEGCTVKVRRRRRRKGGA